MSEQLLGPTHVRELAAKLEISPTKKLGQNFVIDPNTVRKIIRLAQLSHTDHALEIGPGLGSLSLGITATGARLTAVEIDRRLAAELPHTVSTFQNAALARLRVIQQDAMRVARDELIMPIAAAGSWPVIPNVLVANLPYNVAVPIIMHLLAQLPELVRALVMVQAEVGQRIAATTGSKAYGAPSVKAAWYGSWQLAGTVSRRIFWPVPGVDSVLIAYQRRDKPLGTPAERARTFQLINHAFTNRRKMLRQSLQKILADNLPAAPQRTAEILTAAGIDPTCRAESLCVEQYLAIARCA